VRLPRLRGKFLPLPARLPAPWRCMPASAWPVWLHLGDGAAGRGFSEFRGAKLHTAGRLPGLPRRARQPPAQGIGGVRSSHAGGGAGAERSPG
jgi:hypothetical protein